MAANDQPSSDTAGLDDAIRPQDEALSISPGRNHLNDVKRDRTHGDRKAIMQEVPRCQIVSHPMHSSWLVMRFELVSCRATGKPNQLEERWMVAERACAEREKSMP